jgi:Abortive infection C-terminus
VSLTKSEVMLVVNRWVGGVGGYLGDFTYRTHAEFYPEYCDLEIDPYRLEGTTRERFIGILSSAAPHEQAKILRGILERCPLGGSHAPDSRTQDLKERIVKIAERLESGASVASPNPRISSAVVAQAIADAETLLTNAGAISGVDRVHTSLHGYLLAVCDAAHIEHPPDASATTLFKLLRNQHPILRNLGARTGDIERVLMSCASILDALNPLRNRGSMAHPTAALLSSAEAMLVINVARSILHYLDTKIGRIA